MWSKCVESPTRGQPLNKGLKPGSQSVFYSEVPLYCHTSCDQYSSTFTMFFMTMASSLLVAPLSTLLASARTSLSCINYKLYACMTDCSKELAKTGAPVMLEVEHWFDLGLPSSLRVFSALGYRNFPTLIHIVNYNNIIGQTLTMYSFN